MQPWICVAASTVEGEVSVWDGQTGAALTPLRQNASGANSLALTCRDYLLSAQVNKPAVYIWAWQKEQVLHRCFVAEAMVAIATAPDGAYVAGGGASGSLYLWEAASGRLLLAFPAHYKGISAVCFSDSGGVVVTGGEDTVVHAWLLADLLADGGNEWMGNAAPAPLHAWSQHSLPITALCCGAGVVNPILVSASLDRSCHISSLATGELLRSIHYPASVHAVALDGGEHALYAGAGDGRIFETSLVGSAAGRGDGAGAAPPSFKLLALEGHSSAVTGLCLAPGGAHLVSGSEDGSVRVWELCSHQVLRILQPVTRGPVSCVLALPRPLHLGAGHNRPGQAATAASDQGRKGARRAQPMAPLAKFGGAGAGQLQPWEGAPIILDGSLPYTGAVPASGLLGPEGLLCAAREGAPGTADAARFVVRTADVTGGPASCGDGSGGAGGQAALVSSLQQEVAEARASAEKWRNLHSELHAFCVAQTLGGDGPGGAAC